MEERFVGEKALREDFPRIAVSEELFARFESSAKQSDQFAVLVIRIDDFEKMLKDSGEDVTSGIVLRLARIIGDVAKTCPMKWGRLDEERFACFCPELDEAAAVELARQIQRRLSLRGEETVSIGLAVYRFWPFERTSIPANAQKALDHAAFFGGNTITPFDAVSLNISADKLYQYGDIYGAIEEFKKALMVDTQNVNVHNSLGVCYGVQGKFDQAIDAFKTATSLDPKDVMATYNLGLAHLRKGNNDKALGLFLDAHGLDGDHPDISCQIGLVYREMGQTDTAIEYLEKAARNKPKGARVFRTLGDCYVEKGMVREGAKVYEKAIKGHPTDAKSLSALAHLYGDLGENIEIAIVLARESAAIDPDNSLYRSRLGKLYFQNGELEKALEQFQKASELGEDCGESIAEVKNAMSNS